MKQWGWETWPPPTSWVDIGKGWAEALKEAHVVTAWKGLSGPVVKLSGCTGLKTTSGPISCRLNGEPELGSSGRRCNSHFPLPS